MATPVSTPPTAELSKNEIPRLYDIGLNGVGLLVAWEADKELLSPWKNAFEMTAEDIYVEKRDTLVEEMSENKLDRYYWRSQRSWDYGAGQNRFEVNIPGFPSSRAFLDSQGCDVLSTPGQATLLPAVSQVLSLTNQGPSAPQKLVVTDTFVYVAAGKPNLKRFSTLTASDTSTISTGTETSQETYDLATDGSQVFVALGVDGVHRNGAPVSTQRESFDSTAGYTTTNAPTLTSDTTDFKEGVASLKVVSAAGTSTETKTLTGAPLDFSSVDNFKFWVKQEPDPVAPTVLATATAAKHSTGTNLTLSVPNAQVNDLLLLYIVNKDITKAPSPQGTGWNGLTNFISGTANGTTEISGWIYYRLVTAADGATPSVVVNDAGTVEMVAALKLIRGVNTAAPLTTSMSSTNGNSSGTNSIASLTTGSPLWSTTKKNTLVDNVGAAFIVGAPPAVTLNGGNSTDASSAPNANGLRLTTGHKPQAAIGTPTASTYTSTPAALEMIAAQVGVQPAAGVAQALEVRLQTSAGNYFTRTVTPAAGNWVEDTSSRTGDWATVGVPSWSTINQVILVQVGINTVHYDDLRSVSSATFTHFSDADTRVLGWAKDRLFGAGIKSGTQWAFREIGAGATSIERLVLPDGYQVTDIEELGPYVYFTANRASVSKIYAFDGTNAPFIVLTMPVGENAVTIQPFLGAGCLIGARRIGSTAPNVGQGVMYRAFPQASGHLTSERVAVFGADDGKDYAPRAGTTYLDLAFLGRNFADTNFTGLTAYSPATGGFARHAEAQAQGVVAAAGVFKNHKVFTIDGLGVYIESATGQLVPSGQITSSVIDWNIDSNKVLIQGELSTLPLPSGASAKFDYSTDQGSTFTTLGTMTATGSTNLLVPIYSVLAQIVQTRATLKPDTTGLVSPTLKKIGVAAIYGLKPRRIYKVAIKAYTQMKLKNGMPHPDTGPGLSFHIENTLQQLRDTQTTVLFQPPTFGEEQTTDVPVVRVGSLKVYRNWIGGAGWANVIMAELIEVPT